MQYLVIIAITVAWLVVLSRLATALTYTHTGTRETLEEALFYAYEFFESGQRSSVFRAQLVEDCGSEKHQAVELFDNIVKRCHIPTVIPVRYSDAGMTGILMATALATTITLALSLAGTTGYAVFAGTYSFGWTDFIHLAGIAAGLTLFNRTRGACSWRALVHEVRQRNRRQPRPTTPSWYDRLAERINSRRAEQGR